MFAATTPENTPMAYHASTSANPNLVINVAFIEANYEALESLLRDRCRQMRNNDLQIELEYFSKDYDEEQEMEPRLEPTRAATPPLRVASPRICRRGERTVGFERAQSRGESRVERNTERGRPLEEAPKGNEGQSVNLPPLLAAHLGRGKNGKPLQSSLTSAYGGQALPNNIGENLHSNGTFLSHHAQPIIPASLSIPNRFMPTHIHPYQQPMSFVNGQHLSFPMKTSPGNLPMILGLNEEQLISSFVHGLRTRSLVEHLSTDLPSTYKHLMEKTYTWVEAREVATNGASSDQRDSFESLSKSPKEILATEKAARSFEPPSKMFGNSRGCKLRTTFAPREKDKKGKNKSHPTPDEEKVKRIKAPHPLKHPYLWNERARKILATNEEMVLSCINAEEKIVVNDKYPDQTVTIKKQMPEHFKKELQNLLKSNADIFTWTHTDMTEISRSIIVEGKPFNMEHKLNEYSHIKPIKQNKRGIGPYRNMAACKETEELMKAWILQKVKHQTWVANPVMVKKSDGGWRMCVDFTDINNAYPKDYYPLPEIDWKIESLSGFRLKCFLDAYKGYHQIQMAKEDEDKTAFYAGEGVFCYKNMPFRLKNEGATYQRLVDKVSSHQIGRNLEAYVDDMVIKRHLVTKQGIKANPSKVKAVTDLDQPRTLKDIQSLNGKLAALSWFLSKGAERSLAFFKVLKGCKDKKNIQWTTKANKALEKMKKLIQDLPTLTSPRVGETLTMHLAALKERRIAKWAIELGERDIAFLRRNEKETPSDFLVEIPFKDNEKKEIPKEVTDSNSKWRLYTDRASNSDGLGAGLMLIDLEGLRIAQEMEIVKVVIFRDSQFLVNQIKGTFAAKQTSIKDYLQNIKTTLRGFEEYTVEHVRKNQNKKADTLSKLASMTFEHLTKEVLVEILTKRSILEKEILKVDMLDRKSWMDLIHEYLLIGLLPEDTKEARKTRIHAPQYKLIRGNLYKRSFFTPWFRCVAPPQTDKIIKEIHEGPCGFNAKPHSLVVRITKQGYYWPSMHKEVAKAIQDCEKCKE
ncbi:reverse transcriptase domain-containing protein [Tanacetum coccineum]